MSFLGIGLSSDVVGVVREARWHEMATFFLDGFHALEPHFLTNEFEQVRGDFTHIVFNFCESLREQ
ncbi:MAG: hypothetical protein BTN85_0536 [Candidatus Methanohalarchaeum thermophilum]|uniref:Uncharacterized protein n=1 Tax=Methanohalarchaeum thermophilum TaxID=1903181 RepID=A0A1Q6DUJ6_METT1|nr:MAG: hypothetical protein BTN85_0536 [Candidatus Methanohalarchaeum thermophilum]